MSRSIHSPCGETCAFSAHDRMQVLQCAVEVVVDHDVLILRILVHLSARDLKPSPDLLLAVLTAAAQALLEHCGRWGQHENADGLDPA